LAGKLKFESLTNFTSIYKQQLTQKMDSANPTLINGFEDVINYINNQQAEIKKLQENLERVTKQRDDFAHTCAALNTAMIIVGQEVQQDIPKDEIDERVDMWEEMDNDKLLKILYDFFNVEADER